MIGTVIDDGYRVDAVVGEGQFGVVYRCRDLQLEIDVALKMLNAERAGERELDQFIREARKLARLSHPNVVRVHRLGSWQGHPYIVMELVRGRTLREIAKRERLPLRVALSAARQAAAGLHALHTLEIVHRDLSTSNIMLDDGGVAKIVDLGLAKDLARLSTANPQHMLVGTLAYIAPELIEGRDATPRADVFSFGIILYELLTGRHPFQAEHYMTLLYNLTHREAEPLERLLSPCPAPLSQLIARCIEKRADDFFGRRHELKRIFSRLNATPPGSVSIVGDRKIGKSSLLNHVYMKPQRQRYLELPEKMVMVFLDFQEEKNMTIESFVRALLGITGYELRGRLDVSDCSLDLDGIKTMVQRLDGAGFRLAVLLDEFDAVTTNRNFDLEFFSFLRFLANHYNVAYLTSSARDLQALCHTKAISDSPFFNIFSTIRLTVLQRPEAEELIRVPSERMGRPLAPHADDILALSGLFPFFIQMACAHAFEYLEENPGAARPDFEQIERRFYAEAKLHYRYIWESFDPHERNAMLRVVKGKGIPDALQHVVQELSARHYIEDGAGARVFSGPFAGFVETEGGRGVKRSLLGKWFGGD